MAIAPRPDQIQSLMERAPEGKVTVLNLLRFDDKAAYADGRKTDLTGTEAYGLYADGVGAIIRDPGGPSIWSGGPLLTNCLSMDQARALAGAR